MSQRALDPMAAFELPMASSEPELRRMRQLMEQACRAPFFRRKFSGVEAKTIVDKKSFTEKVPMMQLEELVSERITSGDPYSRRWCGKDKRPVIVFQAEYDSKSPLYLGFDRAVLQSYAVALTRCWSLLGLVSGDRVAIFDYGTSPISYLASSIFTAYLRRGAADALGCLPVCNDGVANMTQRAVEILKLIRPKVLFVRSDCLPPLMTEINRQLPRLADYTGALVVAENEGLLSKEKQAAYERQLGVPVYRLLRIDIAMFLAAECPACRLLHCSPDLYYIESVPDAFDQASDIYGGNALVITNWFSRSLPSVRYLSQVKGRLTPPGCPRGPQDRRIAA
jgi:phenylacetate-coenzyme A ligase PaaK-like adenylate-forming protein